MALLMEKRGLAKANIANFFFFFWMEEDELKGLAGCKRRLK
jgi:hypothetical protein